MSNQITCEEAQDGKIIASTLRIKVSLELKKN